MVVPSNRPDVTSEKSPILKFSLNGIQDDIGYLVYIEPIGESTELIKTSGNQGRGFGIPRLLLGVVEFALRFTLSLQALRHQQQS